MWNSKNKQTSISKTRMFRVQIFAGSEGKMGKRWWTEPDKHHVCVTSVFCSACSAFCSNDVVGKRTPSKLSKPGNNGLWTFP